MAALLLAYNPEDKPWDEYVWVPKQGYDLPAGLLSRLTEAADGRRDGRTLWLVAHRKKVDKGFKVIGKFFPTAEAAYESEKELLCSENPDGEKKVMIFGPFLTEEEGGQKVNQIKLVKLVLQSGCEICLDGSKYDALFWSLSAYDKFVVPYYVQIGTLEEAAEIRKRFKQEVVVAGTHIPGSEIIETESQTATDVCPEAMQPRHDDGLGLHSLDHSGDGAETGFVLTPF